MIDVGCAKGELNLKMIFHYFAYKYNFNKEHPHFFRPDGTIVFVGEQGSGKSLFAYEYVDQLMKKYPLCKMVTNLDLRDYPVTTFDSFISQHDEYYKFLDLFDIYKYWNKKDIKGLLSAYDTQVFSLFYNRYMNEVRIFPFYNNDDLRRYKNGEYGIIFFIDEIALYMNNLESKNLNMAVMGQLAQQRKQRLHIVATTQRIGRTVKQLREQYPCIMRCNNVFGSESILGFLNRNELLKNADIGDDGHVEGDVYRKFWSIHNVANYGAYDTYAILEKGQFCSGEKSLDLLFNSVLDEVKLGGKSC